MRGRVVAFAALCAVAVAAILWLALGRGEAPPPAEPATRPPPIARQVDPAPEIGAESRQAEPAPEEAPVADFTADDAPVVEVLDILEALARGPEVE
jgi:hypothetical protein